MFYFISFPSYTNSVFKQNTMQELTADLYCQKQFLQIQNWCNHFLWRQKKTDQKIWTLSSSLSVAVTKASSIQCLYYHDRGWPLTTQRSSQICGNQWRFNGQAIMRHLSWPQYLLNTNSCSTSAHTILNLLFPVGYKILR